MTPEDGPGWEDMSFEQRVEAYRAMMKLGSNCWKCGYVYHHESGKCPSCGNFNPYVGSNPNKPARAITPDELIAEREKTHGDFKDNARIGQTIRHACRQGPGWNGMSFVQREALDHIAGKIARIVSGDFNHEDHIKDIIGYATLFLRSIKK